MVDELGQGFERFGHACALQQPQSFARVIEHPMAVTIWPGP